jgi:hypothetical protein
MEVNKMTTNKVIVLARKHLGGEMESSARLCLAYAIENVEAGDLDAAKAWATKSLAYSVGILHPDYDKATAK